MLHSVASRSVPRSISVKATPLSRANNRSLETEPVSSAQQQQSSRASWTSLISLGGTLK